jgi:hypothetical protein
VIDWDRQNGTQVVELDLPCKNASIIENSAARQSLIFIEAILGIDDTDEDVTTGVILTKRTQPVTLDGIWRPRSPACTVRDSGEDI